MSVMSAGKKPRALVRPLRAGNSRVGVRPGRALTPSFSARRDRLPRSGSFGSSRLPMLARRSFR